MSSPSTSHGYFESVSTQLSLSVGSSFEDVTILTQIQWKCNLFEAKAIRNYHIEEVLKIVKSKLKKNTNEIVMLNNSFIDKTTNKKVIGRKISYENIVLFFCEWEFPGKDEYMEFLFQFNGLFFPDGLILKK